MLQYRSNNHIKRATETRQRPVAPLSSRNRGADTMTDHTPFFPENLEDYAPWVAIHGLLAPYGECQCGCGQDTKLASRNHNQHGWRKGHPIITVKTHVLNVEPLEVRFWKFVDKRGPDECWGWKGTTNNTGYGNISVHQRPKQAHRVSYELNIGPIPEGMDVCHTCDNPPCTNPNHLFAGTRQDNVDDMIAKERGKWQANRPLHKEKRHIQALKADKLEGGK